MMAVDTDNPTKPEVFATTSTLRFANYWDHFLARWAVNRSGHRVEPGLYALGNPTPDSPVFVSANYTLSFDSLRSSLKDIDGFILVLDTQGINVWCAAGKGTFGTDELVKRIEATHLQEVVNHRNLILPQLGAPGVAGFEVTKRSHFKVEYGPVRARDLPEYLKTHTASPEMRRVQFTLRDRLTLIPVELVGVLLPLIILLLIGSRGPAAAILAGTVLIPILLPWVPTYNFSSKGFILGAVVALPFAIAGFMKDPSSALWLRSSCALASILLIPPITAFLSLNFTGSTTFTSRSGVQREMFSYIPTIAWMFGAGLLLNIGIIFVH
jgi:hypothetical protein